MDWHHPRVMNHSVLHWTLIITPHRTYLLPSSRLVRVLGLLGRKDTAGSLFWLLQTDLFYRKQLLWLTAESLWIMSVGIASGWRTTFSPLRSKQSSVKWAEQTDDWSRGCQLERPTAFIHWASSASLWRGNLRGEDRGKELCAQTYNVNHLFSWIRLGGGNCWGSGGEW